MKISSIYFRPVINKKRANNIKINHYTSDTFAFSGKKEIKPNDTVKIATYQYLQVPLPITPERKEQLEEFQNKYGLRFNDIKLLNQAFSYNISNAVSIIPHNYTYEKLEFIGDSVLNLCTTKLLSEIHGSYQEGRLTKLRDNLVSNNNIAAFAKKIGLDEMSYMLKKEKHDQRLADMFEALLGAIFIDGKDEGFKNAFKFFKENFSDEIASFETEFHFNEEQLRNYLDDNNYDSSKLNRIIDFWMIKSTKEHIAKVTILYDGKVIAEHVSNNKNRAKQEACKKAYLRLINEGLGILD